MNVYQSMYSKKIVIRYTPDTVQQPVIYLLAQKHNLVFNILKARIYPRREGVIVLELSGQKEDFDRGIRFLKEMGLKVEPLSKSVSQNTDKCVHCGACTGFCPTGALSFEKKTQKEIELVVTDNHEIIVNGEFVEIDSIENKIRNLLSTYTIDEKKNYIQIGYEESIKMLQSIPNRNLSLTVFIAPKFYFNLWADEKNIIQAFVCIEKELQSGPDPNGT